ncbi:proline-rich protein 36-like [Nyctibius grandis]|uniref:proline-rich protein 36-like n=1 Tax=Nyctibius grandis TaxID=48427 RepID=UPI0035BBA9DB
MVRPPQQLPARGPRFPPAPRLLQPLVLPKTIYPQGSAILYQLPRQERPFLAAWAPPGVGAPPAPQAPPAALQMAPCGCCFGSRLFSIQRTVIPVAPAPPVTLTSQHSTGMSAQNDTSSTATTAGTAPDSTIPPGSDVPPSACAAPHDQGPGDLAGDPNTYDEEALEEALRLLDPFLDTVGLSLEDLCSSLTPGHPSGTSIEGTAVAPAPPVLQTSIPGWQQMQGQASGNTSCSTATSTGTALGSDILQGSNIPPSPSTAHHDHHTGDSEGDLEVPQEAALKETSSLFEGSIYAVEVDPESPSSSPVPGAPSDTDTEQTAVAQATPVLPMSTPSCQHMEGQAGEAINSGTATPVGSPLGSDVHPSPCAAPHNDSVGDPGGDPEVPQEEPLDETWWHFESSMEVVEVIIDSATSNPMPGDPGDTAVAVPQKRGQKWGRKRGQKRGQKRGAEHLGHSTLQAQGSRRQHGSGGGGISPTTVVRMGWGE